MAFALKYIYKCFVDVENILLNNLLQRFTPGVFAPAVCIPGHTQNEPNFSLEKLLQNSILWAVPKRRRSLQKRRCRKFGFPEYNYKPIVGKANLLVCNVCHGYYESGLLCGTCYKKVMDETKEMQEKIQAELGLSPVEEEVVVLYDGEQEENPNFWKGKRIVEMKKPRPSFFSRNLLQRSTQPNAKTKEVAEIPHVLEYK